jgi:hypothetical protein
MRAILIDPTIEGGLVTEGDFDIDRTDVRSLYKILGVDNVERAGPLSNGDMVYVDGYGLLKATPGPFFIIQGWHQPLAGRGLLFSETRTGLIAPPRTPLRKAKTLVSFPNIELTGFEDFADYDDGLVFGQRAVFRPKGGRDT